MSSRCSKSELLDRNYRLWLKVEVQHVLPYLKNLTHFVRPLTKYNRLFVICRFQFLYSFSGARLESTVFPTITGCTKTKGGSEVAPMVTSPRRTTSTGTLFCSNSSLDI